MTIRRPLDLVYAVGCFGWPVGLFVFGGFKNSTGTTIIGVGSVLVLAATAIEMALRVRDRRRARRRRGVPER